MPCGKRPVVKTWDHPRNIRVIKPSRYQQNEASVKLHWRNVVKDLEASYKDEQFWESNASTVRGLVSPLIFERLAKIFNLPVDEKQYVPRSETSSLQPSADFYTTDDRAVSTSKVAVYSASEIGFSVTGEEEEGEEEEKLDDSEEWSVSSKSVRGVDEPTSKKSIATASSAAVFKSSQSMPGKSLSKLLSRSFSRFNKSSTHKFASKRTFVSESSLDESAFTDDDIVVHPRSKTGARQKSRLAEKRHLPLKVVNPHFEMLYCNDSETDMIKWNSKYKQKKFEISASDEYSKKAEILTKQIAYEFFEWWEGLGAMEFKSEIKRPKDIEDLFQIWFDEHASRGLILDPKILPCVLESIANYVGAPETSCPAVLKRMIAGDIEAETKPEHTVAFNTCLPHKMKHLSPDNNTKELWHAVRIPEDLRSMACVWQDIAHLTSTKAFQKWLQQRPYLPMPPFLKSLDQPGEKKHQLFVVPSDFIVRDRGESASSAELALPVSEFSLEIKEVLSKLMNE